MGWTRIFIHFICLDTKKKKIDLFSTRGSVSVILYYKAFFLPTYNAGILPHIIKNVSYVHFKQNSCINQTARQVNQ